jgi:hypothetical protein
MRLSGKTRRILQAFCGTLTHASKMPGPCAPSLPARDGCPTGKRLSAVPGTPCFSCYAWRLQKAYPAADRAWRKNMSALYSAMRSIVTRNAWIRGMAALLTADAKRIGDNRVRWFVSGDIQNETHLRMILRVCRLTPHLRHRIPTQETALVSRMVRDGSLKVPSNVVIQLSMSKVNVRIGNHRPFATRGLQWTTVSTGDYSCPASSPDVKFCGDCASCWSQNVPVVTYHLH